MTTNHHGFQGKLGVVRPPVEKLVRVPEICRYYTGPQRMFSPLVPDGVRYSAKLPSGLWGMLGNDQYGDCVFVTLANDMNIKAVNAGWNPRPFTADEVLAWYSSVTGFRKDDPSTDNGTDPVDALRWAKTVGLIKTFGQVSCVGEVDILTALSEFGGVQIALDMQPDWSGTDVWDYRSGKTVGGHMVSLVDFDRRDGSCRIATWGSTKRVLTRRAREQRGICALATITDEWMRRNALTILGLDMAGLESCLMRLELFLGSREEHPPPTERNCFEPPDTEIDNEIPEAEGTEP